ncbi:MAG: M20/M25/M40 family metallo-hydrolase [Gemmatimonadota bacterium]
MPRYSRPPLGFAVLLLLALATPATAQSRLAAGDSALAAEILEELIETPSVSATPEAVRAAQTAAERLLTAGFTAEDVEVTGPPGQAWNLVARYRGTGGGPPILLMAHLDVVPAERSDWSYEPFALTLEEGWWYGRGTTDNKAGAAILLANFIRWRTEGWTPVRDLVMVLTGDEETTSDGIKWLLANHPWLKEAALALNTDAGGGVLEEGRETIFDVQASEKIYFTVRLEITHAGGHSSIPTPDNAIVTLARGLVRLAAHRFPIRPTEVTRAFFARMAGVDCGPLAEAMRAVAAEPPDSSAAERLAEALPLYNSLLRTTCVATRLEAGHADNALPQSARATVNCRILPGGSAEQVEATLREVLEDDRITIERVNVPTPSPPSPLTPEVLDPIEAIVAEMWPGVPVVPSMSTGATDGLYVRNAGIPVYGVSAIFESLDDVRAHGRDERIDPRRFYQALEFWRRLVQRLASQPAR